MSTKCSLYWNDSFHLYTEAFDRDNVYLEVYTHGDRFNNATTVVIPLSVWKDMRTHSVQPEERYMEFTDEEMLAEAERCVDEHRTWLVEHKDTPLGKFAGVFTYGPPETSREEMISNWLISFGRKEFPDA